MTRYLGFCIGTEYEYGSGEIDEILIIMFMMIDMFISLIVSVARDFKCVFVSKAEFLHHLMSPTQTL